MFTVQNHSEPIAIADRTAQVTWEGSLAERHRTIHSGSGALTGDEVTWVARTEQPSASTLGSRGREHCPGVVVAARSVSVTVRQRGTKGPTSRPPRRDAGR